MAIDRSVLPPDAYDPACPTRDVLDLVADKWTVLIFGKLAGRTYRYNGLRDAVPGISLKMLTRTLRSLERNGLVRRTTFGEVPPRVEYSLSPLGTSLVPLLAEIRQWSEEKLGDVLAARVAYDASGDVVQELHR